MQQYGVLITPPVLSTNTLCTIYKHYSKFLANVKTEENPRRSAYVYDVMDPVVVRVPNVDAYRFEGQSVALLASLDSDGTGHHGIPGTAQWAVLHYTTARGTVVESCRYTGS